MIRASGRFVNYWKTLDSLDLGKKWYAVFWILSERRSMLGTLDPSLQEIVAMRGGTAHLLWDPTGGSHAARMSARKALADELEDASADDDPPDSEGEASFKSHASDFFSSEEDKPNEDKKKSDADKKEKPDSDHSSGSKHGRDSNPSKNVSTSWSSTNSDSGAVLVEDVADDSDDDPDVCIRVFLPEHLGGGKICYYYGSQDFVAKCGCHGSKCRRSRTRVEGRREPQGRPLGALMAWLMDADAFTCKSDHEATLSPLCEIDYDVRVVARDLLSEIDGADALFAQEKCLH